MTAQIHEKVILEGVMDSMAFCPPLPEGHPRIFEPDPAASGRDPDDRFLRTTACWRGYQGTWEVSGGRFFLVGLRGRLQLREGPPIFADWFSGTLRIPRGSVLVDVHMGFGTVHAKELHVEIVSGRLVATRVIDNRGELHDEWDLGRRNLPGGENRFPGDGRD